MIIAAFGAPTVFAGSGFRVLRTILEVMAPGYAHIETNSLDELRAVADDQPSRLVCLTSYLPDVDLIDFLVAQRCSLVLFWSEATEILADHLRFGEVFMASAQMASKYFCVLEEIRETGLAEQFEWPRPGADLSEFVARIVPLVGTDPDGSLTLRIMETLAPGFQPSDHVLLEAVLGQRTTESDVAEKIPPQAPAFPELGTLFGVAEQGGQPWRGVAFWPHVVFTAPQSMGRPIGSVLDLTGAGRAFINGPYFHLPPGSWHASARFRLRDNVTNNSFRLEIRSGENLVGGDFKLPASGEFTCDLPFATHSSRYVVELRFILLEGAIGGSFELLGVTISPVP